MQVTLDPPLMAMPQCVCVWLNDVLQWNGCRTEIHGFYEFYGQVGSMASKCFQSLLLSSFFFTDLNVGKGIGRSRQGRLRRRGTPEGGFG